MTDFMDWLRRNCGLIAGCIIAAVLASSLFLPELVSGIWHARHLSFSARYKSWDVPVPSGWFASGDAENLVILRASRFFPRGSFARVSVFSYDTHRRDNLDQERLKLTEIESMQEKGYAFTVEESFQSDGFPASCWTFQKASDAKSLRANCHVWGEPIAVQYEGPSESIFILRKVLMGIRSAPKK